MTDRVTSADVKAIIDTPLDVCSFITTAHTLVDVLLLDKELSDDMLRQVELYLAAHFAALTEERGGLIRSSTGEGAETMSDSYEMGLSLTRYGQQAMVIDTSGTLKEANEEGASGKARFEVF